MSVISDSIEMFIISLLEKENGVELRRNELADFFGCAPSQINYVLSTRFTIEKGFIIQSKRGGGGYIAIKRIPVEANELRSFLTNNVGVTLTVAQARALLDNLFSSGIITKREALIMGAALNDFPMVDPGLKSYLRAKVFKNMVLAIMHDTCGHCQNKIE